MFRRVAVLSAAALLLTATGSRAERFGWTISASDTDPYISVAPPCPGPVDLYLWYACNADSGIAAVEMDLVETGFQFFQVTPLNGFLNGGSGRQLLLAVAGCPVAPIVAARVTVVDPGSGGSVCLGPSALNGNVSVPCADGGPSPTEVEPNAVRGFTTYGSVPCETGTSCFPPVSVEGGSWGRLKGLYRAP